MNKIIIVGAGPGAEDLITLRGAKALQEADFVLYAGSLVNPQLLKHCKKECVIKDSANMNLKEQVSNMLAFAKDNKKVVRLHTGDPAIYGAINEQIRLIKAEGCEIEIVPGVSSVFGATARLGIELTSPEISQSVVLTRTPGRTPMPEKEKASAFAKTGATLVFFLSTGKLDDLMEDLHKNGDLSLDTPVAVVYRATWEEECILRGTIADISQKVEEAGFGRQALIFVGKALQGQEDKNVSKLYEKTFSHGYRNNLQREYFQGTCALYAFSKQGLAKAKEITQGLNLPTQIYSVYEDEQAITIQKGNITNLISQNWNSFDAHIFIGATGIAVRSIAPCLEHKSYDPAVLSCSDSGSHIISLVSGHIGGANRLARKIARITGGQACISTATDTNNKTGIDEIAMELNARILNPKAIKTINTKLLHNEPLDFIGDKQIYEQNFERLGIHYITEKNNNSCIYLDFVDEEKAYSDEENLYLSTKSFVLGIGCRKNVDPELVQERLHDFLSSHNISEKQIARISSVSLKKDEKAILNLAEKLHVPTYFYKEQELKNINIPNPSQTVHNKIGVKSVSEASSLLCAGYPKVKRPFVEKTAYEKCLTFALTKLPHGKIYSQKQGIMSVVGLGSGLHKHITPEVMEIIKNCDVIAGYTPYLDFIRNDIGDKPIIQNGMMGEMERCKKAMQEACKGKHVCMVCSGDPGILAMAGLLLELRRNIPEFNSIIVNTYAGITSANIAAASLGAPLQNGFCLVSLSDLLVPSDEVRKNLHAVANSALPIALYNPAGKKRRDLLHEAIQIFLETRGKETLSAYVKNAGRDNETKWIGKLQDFPFDEIDMSTLLIIGSERTIFDDTYLYEARGYMEKYNK